jgi:hypothetical protein
LLLLELRPAFDPQPPDLVIADSPTRAPETAHAIDAIVSVSPPTVIAQRAVSTKDSGLRRKDHRVSSRVAVAMCELATELPN